MLSSYRQEMLEDFIREVNSYAWSVLNEQPFFIFRVRTVAEYGWEMHP